MCVLPSLISIYFLTDLTTPNSEPVLPVLPPHGGVQLLPSGRQPAFSSSGEPITSLGMHLLDKINVDSVLRNTWLEGNRRLVWVES